MKLLYLLRHAKSSWDDSDLADRDRPLSPRGEKAAKKMRRYIREAGVAPALVLCSPALRARQTLELIAPALGKGCDIVIEDEVYANDARRILKRLQRVPASVAAVMVVGHNPSMQELALLLACRGAGLESVESNFSTGALATLVIARAPWAKLDHGDAELAAYITPKDVGKTGANSLA